MNSLNFSDNKDLKQEDLLKLYKDAKWLAYTNNPDLLQQAISNSLYVLTAWENGRLVGLIRLVGDGLTIVYIQDILVLKSHKRRKIGTTLLQKALEKYKNIRQKVLLTDDNEETRGFYEALGFTSCDKGQLVAFVKLENKK
ncbi:MAG: GNAT family N-acetyltransferase [Flavobacteriales bacterium CG18_big_fil_WC_8_21_14_2_50_32_9]|nr:GNAT family N-acetyltransferase [Flavobacteriales bacterium]PIQ14988.1 MAG: GNAT family N-acetyltransferase [Flavobacteriales bacterium CG18_big_fil_WC_8_21_14_2_50_32_9]PJC62980.1 MAG: GNAT family N-acetyltransferase [Flavobacteriales bacterium CG_4_9_14_0_2_um_filter_32_27]